MPPVARMISDESKMIGEHNTKLLYMPIKDFGSMIHVPPRKEHSREMGTVIKTTDIFTPIKPFKEISAPSRNKYSLELNRLITFTTWDTQSYGPLQSLLAKAGFFYTEEDDTVECFACGVRISNWDANKDPVKEHATASPTCLYQKLNGPLSSLTKLTQSSDPLKIFEVESKTMQCDVKNQLGNNNPIQMEVLQSMPAMKNARPSNDSYQRHVSCDGEDMTDMFSIADPRERTAHPKINLLRQESCRIQTFRNWPSNAPVTAAELARSGFFYVGPSDRVQCAFCRGILRNWAPGDSAMDEHRRHFATCGFVRGSHVDNVPLPTPAVSGYPASMRQKFDVTSNEADMYEETGIIENSPKHPEFAVETTRLATFKDWPRDVTQTPQQLAKCGFYSLGIDDSVKCFFCDGGLRSWEPNDDPWVEHARWFNKCGYLRQQKGITYIQDIRKKYPSYPVSAPGMEPVEPMETSSPENDVVSSISGESESPQDAEVNRQMQRLDFKGVFEMGFPKEKISEVIRRQHKEKGTPFLDAAELTLAILNCNEDSSSSSGSDSGDDKCGDDKKMEDSKSSSKEFSETVEASKPGKVMPTQCGREEASHFPSSAFGKLKKTKRKKREDPNALQEQIRVLKEERVCKVCLDEMISIVFLPCGHMVCCGTCAPALRVCPICRENIKGNVKAYIA